jgi:hypothetical protein
VIVVPLNRSIPLEVGDEIRSGPPACRADASRP